MLCGRKNHFLRPRRRQIFQASLSSSGHLPKRSPLSKRLTLVQGRVPPYFRADRPPPILFEPPVFLLCPYEGDEAWPSSFSRINRLRRSLRPSISLRLFWSTNLCTG